MHTKETSGLLKIFHHNTQQVIMTNFDLKSQYLANTPFMKNNSQQQQN